MSGQAPDGRRHTTGQNVSSNAQPEGEPPAPGGKKPNGKSKIESFREWLASTSGWAAVIVTLLAGSAVGVKVIILSPKTSPGAAQASPSQISTSSSNDNSPPGVATTSPPVTTAPVSQASFPLASNSPVPVGAGVPVLQSRFVTLRPPFVRLESGTAGPRCPVTVGLPPCR